MYFEDKFERTLTIKEKRIIFMIREGGFRGFGFEVKNTLLNTMNEYRNFRYPDYFIYNLFAVSRQIDLLKFFKILSSSHYTQEIIKVGTYLQQKDNYSAFLSTGAPLIAFFPIRKEESTFF